MPWRMVSYQQPINFQDKCVYNKIKIGAFYVLYNQKL